MSNINKYATNAASLILKQYQSGRISEKEASRRIDDITDMVKYAAEKEVQQAQQTVKPDQQDLMQFYSDVKAAVTKMIAGSEWKVKTLNVTSQDGRRDHFVTVYVQVLNGNREGFTKLTAWIDEELTKLWPTVNFLVYGGVAGQTYNNTQITWTR